MKIFICTTVALLLLPAIPHAAAGSEEKLLAWWSMDAISNGIVADKSGNGNDAVVVGKVGLNPGKEGQAAYFDGKSGNYLLIRPSRALDDLVEFSIEAWVCYENLFALAGGADNYPTLINRGSYTNYPALWLFPGFHSKNRSSYGRWCNWIGTRPGGAGVQGIYSAPLIWEKQKWYKVRTVVSVKEGIMRFFRDDAKVGEEKIPFDYSFGRGNIFIGAYQGGGYEMQGWIDEVKIHATILPAEAYPAILTIMTDRTNSMYKSGEQAGFSVSIKRRDVVITNGILDYTLTLDGARKISEGKAGIKDRSAKISGTLAEPGILRCAVKYQDGKNARTALAAAVFDPEKIKPSSEEPEDFARFWEGRKAELAKTPIDAVLVKSEKYSTPKVSVYKVRLANVGGTHVYGWLGVPAGPGPFPVILTLPWAGVYPIEGNPDGYWIRHAKDGYLAMGIIIHDCEPDLPEDVYDELPQVSGYPSGGMESRDTCYFLRAFLGCVRAVDYLAARPDWDKKNIILRGSSQGGGLSIVTAGLDRRVTAVAAAVPALCEHGGDFYGRPRGWPGLVPSGNEKARNVSAYFDAVNFARHIRCPVFVSVGLIDTTCPPMTVYSAFNVMQGRKRMLPQPLTGHVQTKEHNEISERWIAEQVLGNSKVNAN